MIPLSLRLPAPLFWIGCLCFGLAVAIQFQTTLFYHFETYKGLRLCLADLILPVAGLGILVSLWRKRSLWPLWSVPHTYAWLTGLCAIMAAALLNSHAIFDTWSYWGITNKLPGMIVISAYFCLGGWIATNAGEKNMTLFFRCFFGFFIALMVTECTVLMWQDFFFAPGTIYGVWPDYPLKGFMDNRNAYALFALCVISLMFCFHLDGRKILPTPVLYAVAALLPFFMIQIGSRAGLLAMVIMVVILLALYRARLVPYLLAAIAGAILIFGTYAVTNKPLQLFQHNELDILGHVTTLHGGSTALQTASETVSYKGDSFRLQILDISFDMIKDRPFFGSGLGSSFFVQEELRGGRYDIIESTPIWLWVETGIFGLIVFSAFFFLCLRALYRNSKGDDFHSSLSKGSVIALLVFGFITCLHEMMMARQIWLLLGLALALPASSIRKHPAV